MGIVRGISTKHGETTSNVYIHMDKPLDQAVVLSVDPPTPGPKGPDRLVSSVAVRVGIDAFAIFPNAQRTTLIADVDDIKFVGLPGLTGALSGSRFVSTSRAGTGMYAGTPAAIVGRYLTTDASLVVSIDGFVQVPVLEVPGPGDRFDGRNLKVGRAPGGAQVGVNVFRVSAGSGLVEWLIASPGNKTQVVLPDIATIGLALPSGQVNITVYGGHASDGSLVYESLLYRHLDSRGWTAYSYDTFNRYYGDP